MEDIKQCVYCGERATPYFKDLKDFFECRRCGLVMRYPVPAPEELDEMYRCYYSRENILEASTHMESSEVAVRNHAKFLLNNWVKPGMRVLEFGSGTGRLANVLRLRGCNIDGIELSRPAREFAKAEYGLDFFGSPDEIKASTYDFVVSIEVIEHLPQPWLDLRFLFESLVRGGRLYLTTPNRKSLLARFSCGRWREGRKPVHLVLFDFTSLKMLLEDCGFSEVTCIRFSPLTISSIPKQLLHRGLQLARLYGGLCVVATKLIGSS
jgi:SAM-dependent methyltransferase